MPVRDALGQLRQVLSSPRGLLGTILCAGVAWMSWPAWWAMAERWSTDPRYAHGYLVPAFALVLLWLRRGHLAGRRPRSSWWGLPLIAAGAMLQVAGGFYYYSWFEAVAFLPILTGVVLVLAGPPGLRWSWPAIGFLVFMLPLPFRLEGAMSLPLQRVATKVSTYALQTFGFTAVAEGNIIHLDKGPIGVVDACSGLGILFTFFAMSTGVALVIRRPWMDRTLIVLSAVPIALIANISRITVTGMMHELVGNKAADVVFHDLAGFLMMPLALGLLAAELGLLNRLLIEPEAVAVPLPGMAPPAVPPAPGAKGRAQSDVIKRALRAR